MKDRTEQSRADQSMTDWSMILDAGQVDSPSRSASLDRLVRRYWPPLFAYVRATGCSASEANDIVQGFVADVILERNLPGHADRGRGRFRAGPDGGGRLLSQRVAPVQSRRNAGGRRGSSCQTG